MGHFKIMVKVVHIALRLVILVIAPGLLHAKLADEEMGLEKNDEVEQMSPKELDSFIYNTYMMYQSLKNIAKIREPTLALSEYPVKNWSFWQKLSEVYDNLEIIKKQRSLYGLSFPTPNENLESKRVTPSSKDRTETRNSRAARYQNDDNNQNQA